MAFNVKNRQPAPDTGETDDGIETLPWEDYPEDGTGEGEDGTGEDGTGDGES